MTGKQKVAMLLMSLDAASASELLKGVDVQTVRELAVELALLDASGQRDNKVEGKIARQFCQLLQAKQGQTFSVRTFLNETLVNILGKDKAGEIQSQVRKATEKGDPFAVIRTATTDELVQALQGEHPQTIAVVLSELPTKKAQEVLSLLDEDAQRKAVCKMTNPERLGVGVKPRIASLISKRLEAATGETPLERPQKLQRREETLRHVAMVLSGLEREGRDVLLEEIGKHDEETCTMVRHLMVTWEDIPSIVDRSLQEGLRSAEAGKLAVALFGADEEIMQKIRSNISDRAAAMLDEEISLMQEPLKKEVLDAREDVLKPLRAANEEDKLRFIQR